MSPPHPPFFLFSFSGKMSDLEDLRDAVIECSKKMHNASSSEELTKWLQNHLESVAAEGAYDRFALLIAAVVKGNVELAGYRGRDNRTLLDAAAFGGNANIVSGLLQDGAMPDLNVVSDSSGRSALYLATVLRHEEAACRLAAAGANVDFCDPVDECAVLLAAAQRGLQKLTILLVEKGANVMVCEKNTKRGVLHMAAKFGSELLVKRLLDNESLNIDALSENGSTPLVYAASRGHATIVDTLLVNGADAQINQGRYTSITYAASKGHVEVLRVFARHGIDFNAGDDHSNPLLRALECGQEGVIDELINGGVDIERRTGTGHTPLHYSIAMIHFNIGVMNALLFHGADISKTTRLGYTPLALACYFQREGFAEAVDSLLRKGADETAPNKEGKTPVQFLETGNGSLEAKERARRLIDRAPNDRAWRRRSWLIMLSSRAWKAAIAEANAPGGISKAPRVDHAELEIETGFGVVVESLVGLEEGVFRNVMGFL